MRLRHCNLCGERVVSQRSCWVRYVTQSSWVRVPCGAVAAALQLTRSRPLSLGPLARGAEAEARATAER